MNLGKSSSIVRYLLPPCHLKMAKVESKIAAVPNAYKA
jgi:hypothetical protein